MLDEHKTDKLEKLNGIMIGGKLYNISYLIVLLFVLFIINFVLAIKSWESSNQFAVYLLILLFLYIRMCPPETNIDFEEIRALREDRSSTRSLNVSEEHPGVFRAENERRSSRLNSF